VKFCLGHKDHEAIINSSISHHQSNHCKDCAIEEISFFYFLNAKYADARPTIKDNKQEIKISGD